MSYVETEGMQPCGTWLTQQCDYASPELACKLCVRKGFTCGPKVGGENQLVPVVNPPQNQREMAEYAFGEQMVDHEIEEVICQPFYPEDEVPDPMDAICLEYYFTKHKGHWSMDCGEGYVRLQEFLNQRLGGNLSKPIKFAIILSTSMSSPIRRLCLDSWQTSRCLNLFYRYAREAIIRELYIDLVIACYYIIIYSFH